MTSIESNIANILSIIISVYVIANGYTFFGLKNIKLINMIQSYASCFILNGVVLI